MEDDGDQFVRLEEGDRVLVVEVERRTGLMISICRVSSGGLDCDRTP
jgi:hypothetical protein